MNYNCPTYKLKPSTYKKTRQPTATGLLSILNNFLLNHTHFFTNLGKGIYCFVEVIFFVGCG